MDTILETIFYLKRIFALSVCTLIAMYVSNICIDRQTDRQTETDRQVAGTVFITYSQLEVVISKPLQQTRLPNARLSHHQNLKEVVKHWLHFGHIGRGQTTRGLLQSSRMLVSSRSQTLHAHASFTSHSHSSPRHVQ